MPLMTQTQTEPTITLDEATYVEVRGAMQLAVKVYRAVGDIVDVHHYEEILTRLDADWDRAVDKARDEANIVAAAAAVRGMKALAEYRGPSS